MENIVDALKKRILLSDGAMGTELYRSGFFINQCYENLNLASPDKILEIHSSYVKAGADILETNTFGANRAKLNSFGLNDQFEAINCAGVMLAKKAADEKPIYIAGSIGPVGSALSPEVAGRLYAEQALVLSNAGADLILLETFHDIVELERAASDIRKTTSIPIIAQLSIAMDEYRSSADEGLSSMEAHLARVTERFNCMDADVVGLNCSSGPAGLLEAIQFILKNVRKPVSCMPNAGQPEQVGNRMLYLSTPEYIGEYSGRMIRAGVRLVGGCCGTTPAHIKEMRNVITSIQPRLATTDIKVKSECKTDKHVKQVPVSERSTLARKIMEGKFVSSVEVNPPKGLDCSKQVASAKLLIAAGVDAINIADGPRATSRMSPLSMAVKLREQISADIIIHFCCRDRNIIGLQADLMGAAALGMNNVLLVTGDRPKLGDYPEATAVFDFDAIGLTSMATRLNNGNDLIGSDIGRPASFFIGVGANPGATNFDEEMGRLERKIEAGAQFIMTQPVFEVSLIERFMKRLKAIKNIPVLLGILPLFSFKNAEFLHNEVPGMTIPSDLRKRMEKCKSKEEGMAEGVSIARELLLKCRKETNGVYIMPPFGVAQLAVDVLK